MKLTTALHFGIYHLLANPEVLNTDKHKRFCITKQNIVQKLTVVPNKGLVDLINTLWVSTLYLSFTQSLDFR